jgi:hypothetical protein
LARTRSSWTGTPEFQLFIATRIGVTEREIHRRVWIWIRGAALPGPTASCTTAAVEQTPQPKQPPQSTNKTLLARACALTLYCILCCTLPLLVCVCGVRSSACHHDAEDTHKRAQHGPKGVAVGHHADALAHHVGVCIFCSVARPLESQSAVEGWHRPRPRNQHGRAGSKAGWSAIARLNKPGTSAPVWWLH